MKKTAIAPSNIAFIKYWGKRDEDLRIPSNDSVSMNLSDATTTTTVEFVQSLKKDEIELADGAFNKNEIARIVSHLDRIRGLANSADRARVVTKNSFPKGTGIASSASGFAALTVAAAGAAGLSLSEKELTILARLGSGSACRSIPDGFVQWSTGETSNESYAWSLFPSDYWDIRDIVVIVHDKAKKISSTEGMRYITTSPYWEQRQHEVGQRIVKIKDALTQKDFSQFGGIAEEDCLSMHAVMMTQSPALVYWNSATMNILQSIIRWREQGLPVYYTLDAGPNVHVLCEGKDEGRLQDEIFGLSAVQSVILNTPAPGAQVHEDHLF